MEIKAGVGHLNSGDIQKEYTRALSFVRGDSDREVMIYRHGDEDAVLMSRERAAEARTAIALIRGLARLAEADEEGFAVLRNLMTAAGESDTKLSAAPRPSAA